MDSETRETLDRVMAKFFDTITDATSEDLEKLVVVFKTTVSRINDELMKRCDEEVNTLEAKRCQLLERRQKLRSSSFASEPINDPPKKEDAKPTTPAVGKKTELTVATSSPVNTKQKSWADLCADDETPKSLSSLNAATKNNGAKNSPPKTVAPRGSPSETFNPKWGGPKYSEKQIAGFKISIAPHPKNGQVTIFSDGSNVIETIAGMIEIGEYGFNEAKAPCIELSESSKCSVVNCHNALHTGRPQKIQALRFIRGLHKFLFNFNGTTTPGYEEYEPVAHHLLRLVIHAITMSLPATAGGMTITLDSFRGIKDPVNMHDAVEEFGKRDSTCIKSAARGLYVCLWKHLTYGR